jgi:response regulator NasT
MARFRQFQALEKELLETRGKLAERRLIERAKGIIMKQQGLTEDAAFQAMRQLAMRKNKKLAEIAESVISASELLAP